MALTACLVSLASCGSQAAAGDQPRPPVASVATVACQRVDPEILRSLMYDYEPLPDVADLVSDRDPQVVVGEVAGYTPGPVVGKGIEAFPYMLMQIRVTDVLRQSRNDLVRDGLVWLAVPRGPFDAESGKPINDAETFGASVPVGTRLVLLGRAARADLLESFRGWVPDGVTVAGGSPQALYLDDCGALVGGFDSIPGGGDLAALTTLDGLEEAVRSTRG